MNREFFLKTYNSFFGSKISNTNQIVKHELSGEEIKEYTEHIINSYKEKCKYEYRVIDYDMYDEDMPTEIDNMGKMGWKIIRVFDPISWVKHEGNMMRVFYERKF